MRTFSFFLLSSAASLLAQQTDFVYRAQGAPLPTVAFIGGEMIGGPTVTGAPYSAEAITETTQTLGDGNRISNKSTAKIARDSAGRERHEQSLPRIGALTPESGSPTTAIISDPVAKMNYTLELQSKRATKSPGPSISLTAGRGGIQGGVLTQSFTTASGEVGNNVMVYSTRARGPEGKANEFKTEDLGTRILEGISAKGTRTTITIPAGQIGNERPIEVVSESWYSPELQVVMMSRNSDPRNGDRVYQLINVSRSEPLPSLFEIPPDYQVRDIKAITRFETQGPK